MIYAIVLALGLAAGALGVWLLQREELTYLRKELAIAQDRLVHAWKEGAVIAPRPAEPIKAPDPLPQELRDCVNEWESPEARAAEEAKLRDLYFTKGLNVLSILRLREENHP